MSTPETIFPSTLLHFAPLFLPHEDFSQKEHSFSLVLSTKKGEWFIKKPLALSDVSLNLLVKFKSSKVSFHYGYDRPNALRGET